MRARLGSTVLMGVLASGPLGGCDGNHAAGPDAPIEPPPCSGAGTICTVVGNGDEAFTGRASPSCRRASTGRWIWNSRPHGRPYILDWQNHRVRRVDGDGRLRTVFGTDEIGDGPIPGSGDETVAPGVAATSISLNHPTDIQFTPDGGTMILAAWHNHKVRQMDVGTTLAEIVCGRGPGFAGDGGSDAAALMNQPKSIALAPSGDLFVLDTRNFRIRRIAAGTGLIDTVAGAGTRGGDGDGGDPLAARFSFQADGDNPEPGGAIALDGQGRLYVADTENHRIRRLDFAARTVETIAGDGTIGAGGDGGPAPLAQLSHPRDIELGPDGRLYIADTENHRIRVVDLSTGLIDTVAGTGVAGRTGDGAAAREALLDRPFGIAFDAAGDLYVADTLNSVIRKVVQP